MGRIGEGLDRAELLVFGLRHFLLVHQEGIDPYLVHGLLFGAPVPAAHLEETGRNHDQLAPTLGLDRRQRTHGRWSDGLLAAQRRERRQYYADGNPILSKR